MWLYLQYVLFDAALVLWTRYNLKHGADRSTRVYWIIEWFVFTFLAAFRLVEGEIGGADSRGYVEIFRLGENGFSEPLFCRINDTIRMLTDNYHVYFFVIYGIIVFGFLFFAKNVFDRNANWLALFFFFNMYVTSFGVMRQWLAMSVGMIAFVFLQRGKSFTSFIIALISAGIHFTMIVYVAIVLFYMFWRFWHIRILCRKLLKYAVAINIVSAIGSTIFIEFMKKTEYSAYVNKKFLTEVSWIGYIPTIVFLILSFLLADAIQKHSYTEEVSFIFLLANLSLMYATVKLGMFRLTLLFWPIRAYMIDLLRPALSKKVVWSSKYSLFTKGMYDSIIFLDCIVYMWRTVGNGALPYVFSFR